MCSIYLQSVEQSFRIVKLRSYSGGRNGGPQRLVECRGEEGKLQDGLVKRAEYIAIRRQRKAEVDEILGYISYRCCVTNFHKLSSLKNTLSHSFCEPEIWA